MRSYREFIFQNEVILPDPHTTQVFFTFELLTFIVLSLFTRIFSLFALPSTLLLIIWTSNVFPSSLSLSPITLVLNVRSVSLLHYLFDFHIIIVSFIISLSYPQLILFHNIPLSYFSPLSSFPPSLPIFAFIPFILIYWRGKLLFNLLTREIFSIMQHHSLSFPSSLPLFLPLPLTIMIFPFFTYFITSLILFSLRNGSVKVNFTSQWLCIMVIQRWNWIRRCFHYDVMSEGRW